MNEPGERRQMCLFLTSPSGSLRTIGDTVDSEGVPKSKQMKKVL